MKTTIVPLIGDPLENLYHLGIKEQAAFKQLEERVTRLFSTNALLRQGFDVFSRARTILKKKETGLFDDCIKSYAEGLGIEPVGYLNFIALFELAAHFGQVYPQLKALLPGCTSVFNKGPEGITHSRLMDFPLIGIFDATPRLYYWKCEGKPSVLSYSCEGLAPLFFQAIHEEGFSFALHHKPGATHHKDGHSVFETVFETLFTIHDFGSFKKEIKKRSSVTKWCFLLLSKQGQIHAIDIDGPTYTFEKFDLNETSPLIFTNTPLQKDVSGFDSYLRFSHDRHYWLKEKLKKQSNDHLLDIMTDIEDQKTKNWVHPSATLSTVGAYHVNLSTGKVDIKEGDGVLVRSDAILRFSLSAQNEVEFLKKAKPLSDFEQAWKRAALAQSAFDQGHYDQAYHELQMAQALIPHQVWKQILTFYRCVWDFKFVTNSSELAMIYKELKKLNVPASLKDQWLILCMRFEKRLGLVLTVDPNELSPYLRSLFEQERLASKPLFTTWMKLLYPRLEILDVLTPHHK
jgi:hypothetical protein